MEEVEDRKCDYVLVLNGKNIFLQAFVCGIFKILTRHSCGQMLHENICMWSVVWNAVLPPPPPPETRVMYEKSVKKIVCILYPEILREIIK
jgi:hypothetical protein